MHWKGTFGSTGGSVGGWEEFIGEIEALVAAGGVPGED
jgi:hypothetical protein